MHIRDTVPQLKGYLKISVEGLSLEKFLNLCSQREIFIWNVRRSSYARLTAFIKIKDFKKLPVIARKIQCRIRIVEKYGLPFFLFRYHKRTILLYGILIFAALLFFLSTRLWQIEIESIDVVSEDLIIAELNNLGIEKGMAIKEIDRAVLENSLMVRFEDISWAGVQIRGTRMIIQFVKGKAVPEMVDRETPCNITAKKAGMIIGIYPLNGSAVAKVGDTVREGELLISGILDMESSGIKYTHAMGRIDARCWYKAMGKVPFDKNAAIKTGEKSVRRYIKAFDKPMFYIAKDMPYDEFQIETKSESFFRHNFIIPLEFVEETIWELTTIPLDNKDWYKAWALKKTDKKLDKMIDDEAKIIDKNIKYYIIEDDGNKGRVLVAEVQIETLEDIGEESMIN